MKPLRQFLAAARESHTALGHFNMSDLAAFKAIAAVAKEKNTPLIIGTSEGEREFFGVRDAASIVRNAREEGIPVFLNADHTKSIEKIKEAVEAGYDAVLFDAGERSLEDNIRETKDVVSWVRDFNKKHGTDVLVEGELGFIGSSSVMLDSLPERAATEESQFTTVEQIRAYTEQTGVDLVAPAVGNIHGMLKDAPNPQIRIDRIRELCAATEASVVLHGGSGISDEQFLHAIKAGISVVHINTELRIAWKRGFELAFLSHPNDIVPYKIIPDAIAEMQETIRKRVELFTS